MQIIQISAMNSDGCHELMNQQDEISGLQYMLKMFFEIAMSFRNIYCV